MPSKAVMDLISQGLTSFEIQNQHLQFENAQKQETSEVKALATKFALNEMALNKWENPTSSAQGFGYAEKWQQIYEIVWLEKQMLVQMSYDLSEIKNIGRELLAGQKKIITALGVIVTNQGEILYNQEIIITNQGLILDITGQILVNTETIIATTDNILGVVTDIQGTVNDMHTNGVTIASNQWSGGAGETKIKNYIWYIVGGLGALLLLFIILKMLKGKKGGK